MTYIYAYTQGNNVYIGKTKNLNDRKSHHKIRFESWDYNIIDSVNSLDKSEWKPLETYWIEQFRQWGYALENLNKGGGGRDAFRTEKEIKQIQKQYKLNTKEKWKEYYKQYSPSYSSTNKEKIAEYGKQWYLNTKKERKEKIEQYNLASKEKRREYYKQYYLNKKQNEVT